VRFRPAIIALCLSLARAAHAQSDADLIAMRATLDQAVIEFEGPQQGQSLVRFEDIVNRLEGERRQGSLSEAGAALLVRAYEYRARVHFNLGNTEKAGDSFRALIILKPQHTLDQGSISPKVVEFFKGVKAQLVGFVTVSSVPQGASVTLNGRLLSVTDFFPLEVIAGDYALEVTKGGYRPETRPVTVIAGETLSLQLDLVRSSNPGEHR